MNADTYLALCSFATMLCAVQYLINIVQNIRRKDYGIRTVSVLITLLLSVAIHKLAEIPPT